ncbi:MAG: ATP-binding cassette domain-containing protein [Armatimonadota bacterium]|nr:ATP-binding cassette domain-containing protein [Armatimonadota bacterium]
MIQFQNVSLEYERNRPALRDVNLTIEQGECVFLLGPSGSGKSTILKLLLRELRATRGRVSVFGRDLSMLRVNDIPKLRQRVGFVPQDILLLSAKTVYENLAYAMRAAGHTNKMVHRMVPEFLERFGVLDKSRAFPSQLSGGEAQRVAIARALINQPRVLLADEPTGHLDPRMSDDILEILVDINQRGTTVVMATHDVYAIEKLNRRVVTMRLGEVVSDTGGTDARPA